MSELVNINGEEFQRIYYQGEPVVTLKMVDELHERPKGTAQRNFSSNLDKLIEGEDYFRVPHQEWRELLVIRGAYNQFSENDGQKGGHTGDMTFLTQTGYLMLIKLFKDDLSWTIYRLVVRHYFTTRPLVGDRLNPAPAYMRWLKEQRLAIQEERKFRGFVLSEVDRLYDCNGSPDQLHHTPLLQEAVRTAMASDPRAKQLPLFK